MANQLNDPKIISNQSHHEILLITRDAGTDYSGHHFQSVNNNQEQAIRCHLVFGYTGMILKVKAQRPLCSSNFRIILSWQ